MAAFDNVAYRVLTEPGVPSQPVHLKCEADSLAVTEHQNGRLLLEIRLSCDRLESVSRYSKTGVSFEAKFATGGSKMAAFAFSTEGEAGDFYAWLRQNGDARQNRPPSTIPRRNVTTLWELAGHRVIESLGIVAGINVRSAGQWGNFTAGLQSIVGGSLSSFISLSRDARLHAYEEMVSEAVRLGANAVLGVHYDSNDVIQGATELMCYGTAVIVEPIAPTDSSERAPSP